MKRKGVRVWQKKWQSYRQMGAILKVSRNSGCFRQTFSMLGNNSIRVPAGLSCSAYGDLLGCFSFIPTRNVSDDLSREALGLIGRTVTKYCLNNSTSWL